jgi:hypothetical protein
MGRATRFPDRRQIAERRLAAARMSVQSGQSAPATACRPTGSARMAR